MGANIFKHLPQFLSTKTLPQAQKPTHTHNHTHTHTHTDTHTHTLNLWGNHRYKYWNTATSIKVKMEETSLLRHDKRKKVRKEEKDGKK